MDNVIPFPDLPDCNICGGYTPDGHRPGCPDYDPESQREVPDDEGVCLCGHSELDHVFVLGNPNATCLRCVCLRLTMDE